MNNGAVEWDPGLITDPLSSLCSGAALPLTTKLTKANSWGSAGAALSCREDVLLEHEAPVRRSSSGIQCIAAPNTTDPGI